MNNKETYITYIKDVGYAVWTVYDSRDEDYYSTKEVLIRTDNKLTAVSTAVEYNLNNLEVRRTYQRVNNMTSNYMLVGTEAYDKLKEIFDKLNPSKDKKINRNNEEKLLYLTNAIEHKKLSLHEVVASIKLLMKLKQ